jgi:hypothetical protein
MCPDAVLAFDTFHVVRHPLEAVNDARKAILVGSRRIHAVPWEPLRHHPDTVPDVDVRGALPARDDAPVQRPQSGKREHKTPVGASERPAPSPGRSREGVVAFARAR